MKALTDGDRQPPRATRPSQATNSPSLLRFICRRRSAQPIRPASPPHWAFVLCILRLLSSCDLHRTRVTRQRFIAGINSTRISRLVPYRHPDTANNSYFRIYSYSPPNYICPRHRNKTRSSADAKGPRDAPQIRNIALEKVCNRGRTFKDTQDERSPQLLLLA